MMHQVACLLLAFLSLSELTQSDNENVQLMMDKSDIKNTRSYQSNYEFESAEDNEEEVQDMKTKNKYGIFSGKSSRPKVFVLNERDRDEDRDRIANDIDAEYENELTYQEEELTADNGEIVHAQAVLLSHCHMV